MRRRGSIGVQTVANQDVSGVNRNAPQTLPAFHIRQFKVIALQIRQVEGIMHTPIRARAAMLGDGSAIHQAHDTTLRRQRKPLLTTQLFGEPSQPLLGSPQALEHGYRANRDAQLPRTNRGLCQRTSLPHMKQ